MCQAWKLILVRPLSSIFSEHFFGTYLLRGPLLYSLFCFMSFISLFFGTSTLLFFIVLITVFSFDVAFMRFVHVWLSFIVILRISPAVPIFCSCLYMYACI